MSDVLKKSEFTSGGLMGLVVAVLVLVVWGVAIAMFGYPAIIVPAVALAFLSLFMLVFMTRG